MTAIEVVSVVSKIAMKMLMAMPMLIAMPIRPYSYKPNQEAGKSVEKEAGEVGGNLGIVL